LRSLSSSMRLFTACILCFSAVALSGCGVLHIGRDFRTVIQEAQDEVFPALVFIKPITKQLGSGEERRTRSFGSGVIISPDGYVVTNNHVAKNAAEIKCVTSNREQLSATVVGYDDSIDLALLKLKLPKGHPPLPTATFADSDDLKEGQFVIALGSPLGLSRSVTLGIVSSARRYLRGGTYHLWIQTDAAINPGNSGGPLVNDCGQVVGINTLKARRGDNIGFAIPANTVKDIVARIRKDGRVARSYTGIHIQPLKDFLSDTILDDDRGVLVGSVDAASPAEEVGLRARDIILRCNGKALDGVYLEDLPAIRSKFAYLKAGKTTALRVKRGGKELNLKLRPIEKKIYAQDGLELKAWGCTAQEINKFTTPGLAYFQPQGVYLLGVKKKGNAATSGLRRGDVILTINGKPATSLANIQAVYDALMKLPEDKREALIEIMRQGYRHSVVLDFGNKSK
jgi:serine protease Do